MASPHNLPFALSSFLGRERELGDIKGNSRVWPLYLILPVIAVGIPVMITFMSGAMVAQASAQRAPAAQALIDAAKEPKTASFYDCGHEMNGRAMDDRVAWLLKALAVVP